jgi:hypothetical protein
MMTCGLKLVMPVAENVADARFMWNVIKREVNVRMVTVEEVKAKIAEEEARKQKREKKLEQKPMIPQAEEKLGGKTMAQAERESHIEETAKLDAELHKETEKIGEKIYATLQSFVDKIDKVAKLLKVDSYSVELNLTFISVGFTFKPSFNL